MLNSTILYSIQFLGAISSIIYEGSKDIKGKSILAVFTCSVEGKPKL